MIFTVVVTASFLLFDSGRKMVEAGEYRADLLQAGRTALREIERDLRAAYASGSAYDTGLVGKDGGSYETPLDEIELIAVNNHTLPRPDDEKASEASRAIDITRISYFIQEEGSEPPGLVRRRIHVLHQSVQGLRDSEQPEEVAREVVGVNFRYYDSDWKEVWDSTRSRKLPKAIEVTVVVRGERAGKEDLERCTTRFHLPLWENVPPEETGQ